jgi:hypothetical protein
MSKATRGAVFFPVGFFMGENALPYQTLPFKHLRTNNAKPTTN